MQRRHQCASMVGRQRNSLSPIAASWALVIASAFWVGFTATPSLAAEPTTSLEYAQPISSRLNPTGHTVSFPVPVKDGSHALGEAVIQLTADDVILVEQTTFAGHVTAVLGEDAGKLVQSLPSSAGFVGLDAIAAAGLKARFDPGLQELQIEAQPDQRPVGDLSIVGDLVQRPSSQLTQPEFFSGYINVTAGLDQNWNTGALAAGTGNEASGRLELDSAVRAGSVVVENRAVYDGDVDASICPKDAECVYSHAAGLKRHSSRVVYDFPEQLVRLQIGDTDPLAAPLQRSIDVLGVSLEKSTNKLRPGEQTASRNGGSFLLSQNSDVDVVVNGTVVQHLQLRPGNYNLKDLPLTGGANDIELQITGENGERSTLSFAAYSDTRVLAEGKSEWGIAAGLPSYLLDNQRTYSTGNVVGTGFFLYGIHDDLTVKADIQGDERVVMGGAGFNFETRFGVAGVHGAASHGTAGTGVAGDFDWTVSNFKGLSGERGESLYLSAEYRSTDFHTPGEFLSTANGILLPEFNYWLRLSGSYSLPLMADMTATISGRYQFSDDERKSLSRYTVEGDRYGADITVSRPIGDIANASLLVGYSNELYGLSYDNDELKDPEFRVGMRFSVRPGETTTVNGSYDSLGGQSSLSAYRNETQGLHRWDTSVDIQSRASEKTASVNAAAGYRGDRGELRLSHFADSEAVGFDNPVGDVKLQRTSVRATTAIAFAGNKVAIGAPVRGGAFAVVGPHDSIGDKDVLIGTTDNPRAQADAFGNALVTDLPAYLPASIPVDVDDLPLGYSLGSAAFDTFAPYKAGYALEVGSNYSVSVFGTLQLATGEPVALAAGTARPESGGGKQVSLFTNAEGRFGAEGLAPGRWIIEMATESGPAHFAIDVPAGTKGLIKVGTLTSSEGPPQ